MGATINSANYVDNRPIREAVEQAERNGLSAGQIACRLGWMRTDRTGMGDSTRLARRLGRASEWQGRRTHALRYDLAVAIIRAIGDDPVDYDL